MIFVIRSFDTSVIVSLPYVGISEWVVLMCMPGHFGSMLFLELFVGDPIECPNKGTEACLHQIQTFKKKSFI